MGRPKGSRNKPKDVAPKKPRKNKAAATKAATTPAASSPASAAMSAAVNSGFKKPTPEQVKALVKKVISRNNDSRKSSQDASELVAKAVETQHFDKKAFNIVKGLYQMSVNRPEAFAITLPHLLSYIDDLSLAEVANENSGMDLDGEADEGDDEMDAGDFGEDAPPDEQPSTGRSPGLRVVPGPAAPEASDVPAAPGEEAA